MTMLNVAAMQMACSWDLPALPRQLGLRTQQEDKTC